MQAYFKTSAYSHEGSTCGLQGLQDLINQLDEGQREKLRLAQSAWLQFREANAEFEADTAR
jgi:hypothetical protein